MKTLLFLISLNIFAQEEAPPAGPMSPSWVSLALEVNTATPTLNYTIPQIQELEARIKLLEEAK